MNTNATALEAPAEILVADDNASSLELLSTILQRHSYRVRPAPNGQMALRSIAAKLPDLILLDIKMPDVDGYEVCRRIKADHRSREIPVIFISALSDAPQKVKGFRAGGVDFITKPFDSEEVLARVQTHLAMHTLQRRLGAQNAKLEQEIKVRKLVESMLQRVQSELEERVADRTRELQESNEQLAAEIEERRRSEQENLQRARELALLNQVIAASVSESRPEAVLKIACQELAQAFKMPRAMAALLDRAKRRITVRAEYAGDLPPLASVIDHTFAFEHHPAFVELLMQNDVAVVADVPADERFVTLAGFFQPRRTQALLITPIIMQAEPVGWIIIEDNDTHPFFKDQIRLAQSVADHVSNVLARIWSHAERRKLEDQYIQAQKMEAIGKLTGGVAHDFNNILTVIMGVSELILHQQAPDDPFRPKLNQIHEAAGRAAALVRQLLAFSRQQVLQPTTLNLNRVVSNIEKMLRRVIGEDIEMLTHFAPDLKTVRADPGQIEQVLMNLAVNARDAMPQGGKLIIETANQIVDGQFIQRHMGLTPGNYVMLAVTDTGIGMDAETRKHIFEPFYTTKPKGAGTGLGLSTVHGIVKQSGGHIWVYSEPETGTGFKIYLPQADSALDEPVEDRPSQKTVGGSEAILVVEDEAIVRDLVTDTLSRFGYTVLSANCADAADRIIAGHQADIKLLLTDVIIPGGESGAQMAARLNDKWPELKVLFMSGYTDEAIVHHGVLDEGVAFIQKPFRPVDLAQKVRQILDDRDSG